MGRVQQPKTNGSEARRSTQPIWRSILERFFQILADAAHRFDGTVNQCTGRVKLVLFSSPIAHEGQAPRGPAPYVGVFGRSPEGVLLVFFSPDEETGSAAQLPPQAHFQILRRITERFPPRAMAA